MQASEQYFFFLSKSNIKSPNISILRSACWKVLHLTNGMPEFPAFGTQRMWDPSFRSAPGPQTHLCQLQICPQLAPPYQKAIHALTSFCARMGLLIKDCPKHESPLMVVRQNDRPFPLGFNSQHVRCVVCAVECWGWQVESSVSEDYIYFCLARSFVILGLPVHACY